jgi:hypothetical protein
MGEEVCVEAKGRKNNTLGINSSECRSAACLQPALIKYNTQQQDNGNYGPAAGPVALSNNKDEAQ